MPKKQVRNGYYYFMLEYKSREERAGRRFRNGMVDVAAMASEEWKALSPEIKEYYNNYAKDMKKIEPRGDAPSNLEKKFNAQGKSFAQLDRENKEKRDRVNETKNFVVNFVKSLSRDDLRDKYFYLIHVNYFIKTDQDEYFPAEMAISEFSLSAGVSRTFHRFIDPGALPVGYAADIKSFADKYHNIPVEYVRDKSSLSSLFRDICEFLKDTPNGGKPPLFTLNDDVFDNTSLSAVKKTLKRLWESENPTLDVNAWESFFKVFPLSHFFYEFRNKCSESEAFPNDAIADTELRKDIYHFSSKIACSYHQEKDCINFCSHSYVVRWANLIRDHCCPDFDLDPLEVDDNANIGGSSGGASSSSRGRSYGFEDDEDYEYYDDAGDGNDDDDDEDEDEGEAEEKEEETDYKDFSSLRSGKSDNTFYTDRHVQFEESSSISFKSSKSYTDAMKNVEKSIPQPATPSRSTDAGPSTTPAPAPASTPGGKRWATVAVSPTESKAAPVFDSRNFPSLGRGKKLEVMKQMQKLNLNK